MNDHSGLKTLNPKEEEFEQFKSTFRKKEYARRNFDFVLEYIKSGKVINISLKHNISRVRVNQILQDSAKRIERYRRIK